LNLYSCSVTANHKQKTPRILVFVEYDAPIQKEWLSVIWYSYSSYSKWLRFHKVSRVW